MNAEPNRVGRVALLLLGVWMGGCFSGKGPGNDHAQSAAPPVAQRKTDLETPLDRTADAVQPPLKDSLAAAAGAAAAKANLLDDPTWSASLAARASWGDQRAADAAGNLSRNWEFHFLKGTAKATYARQLDFFGIELAVVLPENKLLYARNFSRGKPLTHVGPADQEKRCYLTWREGDLSRADVDLLARAGVSTEDRVVLKLLPPAVEAKLAQLEKTYAGGQLDNVRKTRFGIRTKGNGYEFHVLEQFRKERAKQ